MLLAACSEQDVVDVPIPTTGKTPIELSVGGVDAPSLTRAVITNDPGKTYNPFDKDTKIFMVMKSTYGTQDFDDPDNPSVAKYTVARGDVLVSENDNTNHRSIVKFDATNQRYWDDAHARSSQLDVWAYAQKGMSWKTCAFEVPNAGGVGLDAYKDQPYDTSTAPDPVWTKGAEGEIYPAIRRWRASHHYNDGGVNFRQTQTSVMCQDLLFSNNLTNNSSGDNRLKYNFGTRKFPQVGNAHMIFYHAMSKITIHIKKGEGFTGADRFAFTTGNVTLKGFNTEGTFNIKDGEFQQVPEHYDIPQMYQHSPADDGDAYTLEALAIPNIHEFMKVHSGTDSYSRFVENSTDVMIQFTIDGNTYKINSGALYNALKNLSVGPLTNQIKKCDDNGNYIPMEAGKNYVFTFTIGKERISNISAKLADWINVTATEQTPTNDYVTVSVKTNEGTKVTGDPTFDLYRAPGTTYSGAATSEGYNDYADYNWEKSYEKSTSLAETSVGTGIYTTEWFWPDNKTFYHLRSISPSGKDIQDNDATTYIAMTGGVIKAGSVTANDYIWGAPFKTDSPTPDGYSFETGYCNNATKADGQLYKAIGATKDNITLIQHHMTSQVFVDLETTNDAAAVTLTGASVQLINIAQNAKLNLGNGLITGYSNIGNVTMTLDEHAAASLIPAYDYSYGVLPQLLSNTNGTVGIKITSGDGNVYIIDDIRTIKTGGNNINEWLPGRKYYYKFVLKKTGITDIQATIVDWETVTADSEDVQIR